MGFGCGGMGVSCLVVELRGSGVCALGHDLLLPYSMQTVRSSDRKDLSVPA
jgi:hypothetical protein